MDGQGGIQRRWSTGVPALGRKAPERIARGDENVPVEILRLLSDWFAILEERGTVPGSSLGTMVFAIATLEDSLCGMSPFLSFAFHLHGSWVSAAEKVLTTPLPLYVGLLSFT
jgi:ion channel-forming bestrophin family protein